MALRRDPLAFFARLVHEAGDFAHYELADGVVYFLNEPALIREVLVAQQDKFRKWSANRSLVAIAGKGLLTSEGELHRHAQKVARPPLQQAALPAYADTIVRLTEEQQRLWQAGAISITREMTLLTLEVVTQLLFTTSLGPEAARCIAAVQQALRFSDKLGSSVEDDQALAAAIDETIAVARGILARRQSGPATSDLLDLLVGAHREGEALFSEAQVIEEIRTFILAGHVTTANALSASFWLLSRAPEVRAALERDIDDALDGRALGYADLPALKSCEMVLLEALRLHPPVWVLGREALSDCQVGETVIPQGAKLVICPWLLHRSENLFPNAAQFLPARWQDDARARLPRGAYLPFSMGSRSCLGERFALMEGTLVLATIVRQWSFSEPADAPDPAWTPQLVYWPRRGITLQASRRR